MGNLVNHLTGEIASGVLTDAMILSGWNYVSSPASKPPVSPRQPASNDPLYNPFVWPESGPHGPASSHYAPGNGHPVGLGPEAEYQYCRSMYSNEVANAAPASLATTNPPTAVPSRKSANVSHSAPRRRPLSGGAKVAIVCVSVCGIFAGLDLKSSWDHEMRVKARALQPTVTQAAPTPLKPGHHVKRRKQVPNAEMPTQPKPPSA